MNTIEHTPLRTDFTARGFRYMQLKREGDLAIYEVKSKLGSVNYEVIRIGRHDGFPIPGTDKVAHPAETYPGANSWGSKGWTCVTPEEAEAKFEALNSQINKKDNS